MSKSYLFYMAIEKYVCASQLILHILNYIFKKAFWNFFSKRIDTILKALFKLLWN